MKQIKLFSSIFIVVCLLFSCNGNQNTANVNDSSTSAAVSSSKSKPAASSGDASFSYKIDGHLFSGTGTDNYFNCVEKRSGGLLHFSLTTLDFSVKGPPQFHFQVAENGTTNVTKDDMDKLSSGNNVKYFADIHFISPPPNNPRYEFDSSITVTIISNSASGVSGKFSGNLLDPDTDKMVQLTDGVFNLPFKTTK